MPRNAEDGRRRPILISASYRDPIYDLTGLFLVTIDIVPTAFNANEAAQLVQAHGLL